MYFIVSLFAALMQDKENDCLQGSKLLPLDALASTGDLHRLLSDTTHVYHTAEIKFREVLSHRKLSNDLLD